MSERKDNNERFYSITKIATINTSSNCIRHGINTVSSSIYSSNPWFRKYTRPIENDHGGIFVILLSVLIIYFSIKIIRAIILRFYLLRFRLKFPEVMSNLRSEERPIVALLYRSLNYTSRPHGYHILMELHYAL